MCAGCGWLELAAAITENLETRDRSAHLTHVLETAREQILAAEHVTPVLADAVETLAEREGWAVA